MRKLAGMVIVIVLALVHPHKVFDPPLCIGMCLFDGAVPVEQTLPPDDGADL